MDSYRRYELPDNVKRYKAFTNQFQKWLLETAKQRKAECAALFEEQATQTKGARGKKGYRLTNEEQKELVAAIVSTSIPLHDTSGLLDLRDAIRLRNEVTQFHKINETADEGHGLFDANLRGFMAVLKRLMPGVYPVQNLEVESDDFIRVKLGEKQQEQSDDAERTDVTHEAQHAEMQDERWQKEEPAVKKKKMSKVDDAPLSEKEQELQREFLVLSFLYAFNRIRDIIADTWILYRDGQVTAMTAALITDLAQSHVQQNVAALLEELGGSQAKLLTMVYSLYEKLKNSAEETSTVNVHTSNVTLRDLFCIDAIIHLGAYLNAPRGSTLSKKYRWKYPFLSILEFYNTIRRGNLKLSIRDKFTEVMLLRSDSSKLWLPFGFQIMLDIQEIVHEDSEMLFEDITEHVLDISNLIRKHVDYEDRMWAIGQKPDYLTREDIKFSTVFLNPLSTALDWLQDLLKSRASPECTEMTAGDFVTVHSTLAGLTMWQFNSLYHSTAIDKVQWFINSICHLYNAARQIGGLRLAWPDLEFIIEQHGSQGVFHGEPPTDPTTFQDRYLLACCVSTRYMASDRKNTGPHAPRAPEAVRRKRGLMPYLPLEKEIKAYYRSTAKENQWLKRHAIFHHLQKTTEGPEASVFTESIGARENLTALQDAFTLMAKEIAPPKSKNRRKKPRVTPPDFSKQDDTYACLFAGMKTTLKSHELHSNFDYLSFYRRAFDFVLRIREEILLDGARFEDLKEARDPGIYPLIQGLFTGLKSLPKGSGKKTAFAEQELPSDHVAVNQLKLIAQMMETLIQDKGDAELVRAECRLNRDWETLKTFYAADEAGQ